MMSDATSDLQTRGLPDSRLALLRPIVATLVAAAIIGLTMWTGIQRGMDHSVTVGPGEQTAITIALSDSIYGANLGYMGLSRVLGTIQEYWNRGTSGWSDLEALKRNFQNADLLNAGIRAAASLGRLDIGHVTTGTLITTYYDDMGEIEYVKLAFRLFGMKIQSLFYLYFTLVGLSAAVFIWTFRDNAYALALMLATLFAYYVEIHLAMFEPVAVPTFYGMRHGSTLSLVPMWHFAFLLLTNRKPTGQVIAGALFQMALLILAWRIRGAVAWAFMFLFIVGLAPMFARLQWRRLREAWTQRAEALAALVRFRFDARAFESVRTFARSAFRWPIAMLICGVLATSIYYRVALHPIYFTDDIMPQHGLWHVAYLGLASYDTEVLSPRMAQVVKSQGPGDALGWWAARDYMDRIRLMPWSGKLDLAEPTPGFVSVWPAVGLKIALHDRLMRGAVLEAIKNHPFRTIWIFAVKKPPHIARTLAIAFTNAPTKLWLWLVLAAGGGVFAMLTTMGRSDNLALARQLAYVAGGGVLAATLPNLWAYPGLHAMADSVLLLVAFFAVALGVAAFTLLAYWRRKWQPGIATSRGNADSRQ